MSEGVELLISADDQASKVLDNVADNVDAKVKRIRDVGGKAKASTEFIGTLAGSLGNTGFAQAAGSLGQLSEKISAFSEVSKLGGAGALAFKAGLLGVAAVAGFKIGTMIGDWAFETEKWTKKLADANELLKTSSAELARVDAIKLSFRVEKADLQGEVESRKLLNELTQERFKIEKQIEETKAEQLKDNEGLVGWARYLSGNAEKVAKANEAELAASKERLDVIKKETDALTAKLSPHKEEIEALKAANALKEKNKDFIKSLEQEVELLRASKEEHAAIEALQKTGGDVVAAQRVESLLREKEALQAKAEAQKLADAEAKKAADDQARAAEKLADLKKSELAKLEEQRILLTQGKEAAHAFALEQEGMDKATAKRIATEKALLDKQGEKITEQAPQQAVQGRLLTRGTSDDIRKRQLDAALKQYEVLKVIQANTKEFKSKTEIAFEVLGR